MLFSKLIYYYWQKLLEFTHFFHHTFALKVGSLIFSGHSLDYVCAHARTIYNYIQQSFVEILNNMNYCIFLHVWFKIWLYVGCFQILGFFFAGIVLNQFGVIRNILDVKLLSEWGILFLVSHINCFFMYQCVGIMPALLSYHWITFHVWYCIFYKNELKFRLSESSEFLNVEEIWCEVLEVSYLIPSYPPEL